MKITINKTVSAASTELVDWPQNVFWNKSWGQFYITNLPDIVEIVGVYEFLNTSSPTLDSITFPTGLNLDTASCRWKGYRVYKWCCCSSCYKIICNKSRNSILNSSKFTVGEIANFEESNITSVVQVVWW